MTTLGTLGRLWHKRGRGWLAGASLLLSLSLAVSDAYGRPGGGSGFGGGRSKSSGGSRSSGSRSSGGGSSRSGSGSSKPSLPTVSYCVQCGADRVNELRHWAPGMLGPFGSGPARPASLNVEEPGDGIIAATVILGGLLVLVAIPVGGVFGIVYALRRKRGNGWTTAGAAPAFRPTRASGEIRRALGVLRSADPDFSVGLFEDFAYAVYAEAQTARGVGATARLAPYLGANARQVLDSLGRFPVSAVVVGAMRYVGFEPNGAGGQRVEVSVEFETCYSQDQGNGRTASFYCVEQWTFVRSRAARSRPPQRIRVFACPSCGAPLDRMVGGTCGYCNRVVEGGGFDWSVDSIRIVERNERPPILTGTTEEAGTSLPTVFDPAMQSQLAALRGRDPSFDEASLAGRLQLIFQTMQTAWTTLAWESARPYLTDGLFQTNAYWIAAYRSQGLRNVTQGARILRWELVRIDSDRWYDSVTVRVHATGLDYTVRDSDQAIVGGSRDGERAYTEYWTLIRGSNRKGPAVTRAVCPNCGGPMSVSMAATCMHCRAKVNSGEFDWVLSRIEQDEAYGG